MCNEERVDLSRALSLLCRPIGEWANLPTDNRSCLHIGIAFNDLFRRFGSLRFKNPQCAFIISKRVISRSESMPFTKRRSIGLGNRQYLC